jgi:hypothetical protein
MAACAASKIAQQAAITASRVSMVVLRTTPQRRLAMTKIEHTSFALNNPHVIDFAMRN